MPNEEAVQKLEAVYSDPPQVTVRKVDGTAEVYNGDEARAVIAWARERGALRASWPTQQTTTRNAR